MPADSANSDRCHLIDVARAALKKWDVPSDASLRLVSFSENAVFLVTGANCRWILRVHRTGYNSIDAVRSEIAWMRALRDEAGVETPEALPGVDGACIQQVTVSADAEPRMAVLFAFIPGVSPEPNDLDEAFRNLGSMSALMHRHARNWSRPAFFTRLVWDYEHAFGRHPNWGHWRMGFLASNGIEQLERADDLVRRRLLEFGKDKTRFGLIHSDLRLANLLVSGGVTRVIDFDDCGFGWNLYDLGSSMTYLETRADVDRLIASWLDGYLVHEKLNSADIQEIPTFIMFRRLVVMGWLGSHPNTDLAREMNGHYSDGTLELAEKYLSKSFARKTMRARPRRSI